MCQTSSVVISGDSMDGLDAWATQLGESLQLEVKDQPIDEVSAAELMTVDEELAVLAAIYGDEDVKYDATSGVVTSRVAPAACRLTATLRMWLPSEYPAEPPVLQLESFGSLDVGQQDVLYAELMLLAARSAAEGRNALFPLLQLVHDKLSDLAGPLPQQHYHDPNKAAAADGNDQDDDGGEVPGADGAEWHESHYHDGRSSATAAEEFHAKGFLSHALVGSLADVLAKLPPEAGAIRVECIVRQDAKERFLARQAEFAAAGISRAVWTTFHGTCTGSMSSIVRTGLRVPDKDQVRCGSTFGRGIYTSPSASFSLGYCHGDDDDGEVSMLVCAVLPGTVADFNDHVTYAAGSSPSVPHSACRQVANKKHTSVLANRGNELVIFDAAQVLPCFVIHLHHPKRNNCPYLQATQGGALVVTTHTGFPGRAPEVHQPPRPTLKQVMQDAAMESARLRAAFFFGDRKDRQVLEVAPIDDDDDDEWDANACTGTQVRTMTLNHGSLIAHGQYASGRNYQQERRDSDWS